MSFVILFIGYSNYLYSLVNLCKNSLMKFPLQSSLFFILQGCLGLIKPLGDVDFYPNGGDHQEGCDPNVPGGDIVDMASKNFLHNFSK